MRSLSLCAALLLALLAGRDAHAQSAPASPAPGKSALQQRADHFLELVNAGYQALYTVTNDAQWKAATDVTPEHDAAAEAAGKAQAAFLGNPALITETRALLEHAADLDSLTVRELRRALLLAAEGPMTNPDLVSRRIEAETKQASTMNGYVFTLDGQPITANAIDDSLTALTDVKRRLAVWEASKRIGPELRPGLEGLQGLRNGVARELGFADYFALQVAKYDLSTDEMLRLNEEFMRELRPLYLQLHTWAKYELAKRYGQPVPRMIPAHWLPNRWGQEWDALAPSADLDAAFKGKSAEWVVKTAEGFYTSLGFAPLPETFWQRSDLYPVPAGQPRKKNSHAYCYHMDLDRDVRSLMSVEPNAYWFATAHHELGHGFYDLAYARPEVPALLRDGANPSFQEGMGELIALAAGQAPYLESLGLLEKGKKRDEMEFLLRDALQAVPFLYWSSGVMTHWEADLYARNLPPGQWNARWWRYVGDFQGIEPPSPRGEEFCDPATKTHINDFPAYYFAYAIATVLKFQLHDHIAREILKQDPRRCNHAGHPEVRAFLEGIMKPGATRDWRVLLREATGEDLSTRAMVEYFRPLQKWLEKQNRGRTIGWE
jgi:peptidyl-dipeptidase A